MPTPSRSPWLPLAPLRSFLDGLRARRQRTGADRALALALHAAFEAEDAPAGLHFYVFDGVVTVYGTVATESDRERVFARAAALPGVRSLTDHVVVERPPTPVAFRVN